MTTSAPVSVEEYLNSNYEPDCDYVDGELVERNVGEQSHGRLQDELYLWFRNRERQMRFRVVMEVRLQVSRHRFRVPDVMLIPVEAAAEEVVKTPPLLCIEILSPGDTFKSMRERVSDYFAMGVPDCWLVDPIGQSAVCAKPGVWTEVTDGILRAGPIEMPLSEVLDIER